MSNTLQGIVYLTPEQYETLVNDGHITANGKTIAYNKNTLYITKATNSDGTTSNVDLSGYYTKEEVDNLIASIETFDGDYNSLTNKPEIPTAVSQLTNDNGFITSADIPSTDLSNYYTKSETESYVNSVVGDINTALENVLGV